MKTLAMTSRSRTNRLRDERGANLIEFGLVFPLLLMITLGIMQVGIVYNNWVMLTDGVRAGARVLSISRAPGTDACALGVAALKKSTPTLTQASLSVTTTVAANCTNLTEGSDATLAATYPCDLTIMGINFAPKGCLLKASTTERVE